MGLILYFGATCIGLPQLPIAYARPHANFARYPWCVWIVQGEVVACATSRFLAMEVSLQGSSEVFRSDAKFANAIVVLDTGFYLAMALPGQQ